MSKKLDSRIEALADRLFSLFATPLGLLVFALTALWALLARSPVADPDLFARVAVGRLVEIHGFVPTEDPFAFVQKKSIWVDHEWLAGVVFYWLTQVGGDFALWGASCIFSGLTLVFLLLAARNRFPSISNQVVWFLMVMASSLYIWASTIRSQVFTYLFLSIFLYVFSRFEKDKARWSLFVLPIIMVPWCNAHGGFVVGLGLLFLFTLVQTRARASNLFFLWAAFALSVFATALNPYGFVEYWRFILHAVTMPRPAIPEWWPMMPWAPEAILPNLVVIGLIGGALIRRRPPDLLATVFMLVTCYQGYRHSRLVGLFMMTAIVYGGDLLAVFSGYVSRLSPSIWKKLVRAVALAATGAFLLALFELSGLLCKPDFRLRVDGYPVAATEALWEHGPGGKLLVDFNSGSFALWRLYPRYQVSLDGRYEEVYLDEVSLLVNAALNPKASNHRGALAEIAPDAILLRGPNLAEKVEGFGKDWVALYVDEDQAALVRAGVESSRPPLGSEMRADSVWEPRF